MALMALIKRELVAQLRRGKTLALFFLLMGPILLFTLGMWPDTESIVWAEVGMTSKGYVGMIVTILFFGSAMFIPGVVATSLVIERETKSWDLLSLTLIGPWCIILGKFLSMTGLFILFIIGLGPFLCAVFFMVGIDIFQMATGFYMVILTTLTCAALGMLSSAYSRTTTLAIRRSYGLMALNMGFGYLLVMMVYVLFFVSMNGWNAFDRLAMQSFWMTPAYSTFAMMSSVSAGMIMPSANLNQYLVHHTVMQITTIFVALLLTWRKIRKPLKPAVAKKKVQAMADRGEASGPLELPPGFKAIPTRMNPMLFREIHWGIEIKTRVYVVIFLLMLLISGILVFFHFEQEFPMVGILSVILSVNFALISLFALSNLANVFTKEDELKNLDMLKMTLITPGQVVNGKLRAGFRVVNRLVMLSIGINVWLLIPGVFEHGAPRWSYSDSAFVFLTGHAGIWLCGILCVLIAALSSVLCKKTAAAVIMSYAMAGMMYFGILMVTSIIREFGGSYGYGGTRPWEYLYSPIWGYFQALELWQRTNEFSFFIVLFMLYGGVALVLVALVHAGYHRKKISLKRVQVQS